MTDNPLNDAETEYLADYLRAMQGGLLRIRTLAESLVDTDTRDVPEFDPYLFPVYARWRDRETSRDLSAAFSVLYDELAAALNEIHALLRWPEDREYVVRCCEQFSCQIAAVLMTLKRIQRRRSGSSERVPALAEMLGEDKTSSAIKRLGEQIALQQVELERLQHIGRIYENETRWQRGASQEQRQRLEQRVRNNQQRIVEVQHEIEYNQERLDNILRYVQRLKSTTAEQPK